MGAHLAIVARYVAAQGVAAAAIHRLAPKDVKDRVGFTRDVLMALGLPLILLHTFRGTLGLRGSVGTRWEGTSADSFEFLRVYVAVNTFQSILDCLGPGPLKKKVPMFAHHLLSIVCFSTALVHPVCHFWACLAGCCESSTVFVMVLNLSKAEGGFGDRFKRGLGKLFVANGAFLWLAFLCFRMVLFPSWLVMWCKDLYSMPNAIRAGITYFELAMYPTTIVFLLVLSSGWFQRIHSGLMKAVRGKDTKEISPTLLLNKKAAFCQEDCKAN